MVTFSCAKRGDSGIDQQVTTQGTIEVTAKLVEVPGPFPPNDLYNYGYVLKYKVLAVHRGKVDGDLHPEQTAHVLKTLAIWRQKVRGSVSEWNP